MFSITLWVTRNSSSETNAIRHSYKNSMVVILNSMSKNKFLMVFLLVSFSMLGFQQLRPQTSFHGIVKNVNKIFLQSSNISLLGPAGTGFGKSIFSDVRDYTDKSNAVNNLHFSESRTSILNRLLHLSESSFKNEKFVTTSFLLPVNVNRRGKLHIHISYDSQLKKANGHVPFHLHISDYNINATRTFKLSKSFSLKLSGLYSSIGFLPAYYL